MVAIASRARHYCCFSRSFQLHRNPPPPPPPPRYSLISFRVSIQTSSESLNGSPSRKHFVPSSHTKLFHRCYNRHYLVEEESKQQRNREDFKEIVVFWDLTSCTVPHGVDPYRISPNIMISLRKNGFLGPLSIHAYGNTRSLNDQDFLQALVATGIDLHHIPGGMKNSITYFLVDLLLWVKENLPPACVLLISGDKNFSTVMHKLQMRGYDIFWAHPDEEVSSDVLSLVSEVWVWDNIIRGVGVSRRSSTGNMPVYKTDASDFGNNGSETFQAYCEDDSKRNAFDVDAKCKSQVVPKVVHEKMLDIIRLRPAGYTLAAFRRQLVRSNIVLDKDFYGYKDLLSFLLSIREIKASLVWTSDRTRAYMFTEASGESINMIGDTAIIPQVERKESRSTEPLLKQMGDVVEQKKNSEEMNVSQQQVCLLSVEKQDNLSGAVVNKSHFGRIWDVHFLGLVKRLFSFAKPKENIEFPKKIQMNQESKIEMNQESKLNSSALENLRKSETALDKLNSKNNGKNDSGQCSTERSRFIEVKEAEKKQTSDKIPSLKVNEDNKCLLNQESKICSTASEVKEGEKKQASDKSLSLKVHEVNKCSLDQDSKIEMDLDSKISNTASGNLRKSETVPDKLKSKNDGKNDSGLCSTETSRLIEVKEAGQKQTSGKSPSLKVDEGSRCLLNQDSKIEMNQNSKICSTEVKEAGKKQTSDKSLSSRVDEGNKCLPKNIKDEKIVDGSGIIPKKINQNNKPSKVLNHSNDKRDQGHGPPNEAMTSKSSGNMNHALLESGKKLPSKEDLENIGFTEEIWKMSVMYLASEKGKHQFTKDNNIESDSLREHHIYGSHYRDDLVKLLLASNISEVTKYQEHELSRLARLLYSYLYPRNKKTCQDLISEFNSPSDKTIERHDNTSRTKTNKKNSIESTSAKMDMAISTLDVSIQSLVESIVLKDLREMLTCRLKGRKDGVQLVQVKPEFKKKFGYELNNKVLGHNSLSSLIKSLDGVVMTNGNSPVITMLQSEVKKQITGLKT